MTVEIAVLELHSCALRTLGDEAHLHLAGLCGIALDLPLRADVPAEHDSVRRLVREHTRPARLAAVDTLVIDVAADTGLEDCLGDIDGKPILLGASDMNKSITFYRDKLGLQLTSQNADFATWNPLFAHFSGAVFMQSVSF